MRVSAKGQVTIPAEIRERLGILPNSEVEFVVRGAEVVLATCGETREERARRIVNGMRGAIATTMTTDELIALTRGED